MTDLKRINIGLLQAQLNKTIGEKDFWGMGITTESVPLLIEYGFVELGLRLKYSYTMKMNDKTVCVRELVS